MMCTRCDHKIKRGERYYSILGERYCKECRDEWIKDEFEENFEMYAEQASHIMGIRTYTYGGF